MNHSIFDLSGKVALVTGAAHGIGFAIAKGLAEAGATICFNCSSQRSLEKGTTIPVDEKLFAADSHCMTNLKSATLGLYEKGTGRGVVCNIEEFPYTLLWSKKGMPRFVCIEPWQSLPSCEGGSTKWDEKPAAAVLKPGEAWSATLSTSFVR